MKASMEADACEEQVQEELLDCADQEASTSPWWHPRNQGSPLSQDLGGS